MTDRSVAPEPAFPHMMAFGHKDYAPGLSVRDYFAAQALAGLCANPGGPFQANAHCGWAIVNCSTSDVADECYRLADAMISRGVLMP